MLKRPTRLGLSIQQMGSSSAGVVIPAEWRDELDIDTDDSVDAQYDREARTVTLHF